MQDLCYDETDNDSGDNFDDCQTRDEQLLIDSTRNNIWKKLGWRSAGVYIVSCSVIFSLVTAKGQKKTTPAIDGDRLMETILKMNQAPGIVRTSCSRINIHWRSPGLGTNEVPSPQFALLSFSRSLCFLNKFIPFYSISQYRSFLNSMRLADLKN